MLMDIGRVRSGALGPSHTTVGDMCFVTALALIQLEEVGGWGVQQRQEYVGLAHGRKQHLAPTRTHAHVHTGRPRR